MIDERESFGTMLHRLREDRQMSQVRLARLCGLNHSYLSRLESGSREPSRPVVFDLAAAMNLSGSARVEFVAAAGFMPAGTGIVGHAILAELDSMLSDETLRPDIKNIVIRHLESHVQLLGLASAKGVT